jgi:hypothetical protein
MVEFVEYIRNWKQHIPKRNLKMSVNGKIKCGKTSETMEGLCVIMSATGPTRPNTGKSDDDYSSTA